MAHLEISHQGAITHILLNRPEAMNALTREMHFLLDEAFTRFANDETQRIAVIKGAGQNAFCAGSDLKDGIGENYPENGYAGLVERFDLPKPIIAAVNGHALGGGFELALACDLLIATETSSFGLPEPLVGAVALGGGLHRLARQIGLKQAMGMILTSQSVSAEEGLRMGFVNEVVGSERLDETVDKYCRNILRGAPLAIEASKMTVHHGLEEESLKNALRKQASYEAFVKWKFSEDFIEGVEAFRDKRLPKWTGK